MNDRERIADRLKRKVVEIQSLEEKVRVGKVYVQALQDVLKMLDQDAQTAATESVLKPGSTVARARDLIIKSGEPMHLTDLLEAMGKDATREAKASLTSSLAAYVRRGDIFTRPAPSTFGLIELGHDEQAEEPREPPAEFGRMAARVDPFEDDVPF